MKKTIGIYCITNNINHKKYIGLSKNCEKRWADHRAKSINSSRKDDLAKPLYRAMRKYGVHNFNFKILEECSEDQLQEKEIFWIGHYNSYKTGYNATLGGDLPSRNTVHIGEEHGMAKLSEKEVAQCRMWYKEGKESSVIWNKHFSDIIPYSGFLKMWHGKTWKHVMPEVFKHNPRPRRKFDDATIRNIKAMFLEGKSCAQVYHHYNKKISRTTINDIYHNRRYKDIV